MDSGQIMFRCGSCGWTGSGEEAMQPEPEIREDWEKVWKFRKGLTDEFGNQFLLGAVRWEDELADDLVCPRCAGEASRVVEG